MSLAEGVTPVESILDAARWAPSGDNAQPWRFEIVDPYNFVVHGEDTREHCIYDLQGHASQLALGALLENITLAASGHGMNPVFLLRSGMPESRPTFDVELVRNDSVGQDALAPYITQRAVQRRAMSMRKLSPHERLALEDALPSGYQVLWLDGWAGRTRTTRLTFKSAGLRLTLPEAYSTHRDVFDWENTRFSKDRIPAHAVGLDPITLRITRWAMASWDRMNFLNRYLGATFPPRIQLEIVPGIFCAAHFVLYARKRPGSVEEFVSAGRAMQRFWLTATSLGMNLQPEMTPLIFHEYIRDGINFSCHEKMHRRALKISDCFRSLIGPDIAERGVFIGRIGADRQPRSRSVRLSLRELRKDHLTGPQ